MEPLQNVNFIMKHQKAENSPLTLETTVITTRGERYELFIKADIFHQDQITDIPLPVVPNLST